MAAPVSQALAHFFGKMTFWKGVFWAIFALGLYATFVRFTQGIGGVSNLSDAMPWGLWIGFDVLCGVGLAAGGFVVAGSIYIFNLEHYRPILRPAVLTAFLGYVLVCVGLLFDLGRPWNIWHPIIMWNPHSVMFEVGWCVMLYSTVLALEFSPVILERFKLEKAIHFIHQITIPLVILGVILSTLHQSSLGSMFLIVPSKMHPLWYSSSLPYIFFVSAVSVGPAMVTIESFLSSKTFHREIELDLLSKLGKVSVVALAVLFVLRVEDVVAYKLWNYLLTPTMESVLYLIEMVFGIMLPMALLSRRKIRTSKRGLYYSALLIVLGFVLNRMNVAVESITRSSGVNYMPSFLEMSITLFIVASGFALFALAVKYFPVFPEEHPHAEHREPVDEMQILARQIAVQTITAPTSHPTKN